MKRDEWAKIELRHLAALVTVAKHGSFRIAAAELGYVQSAVSQQVADLERIVGTRLIERPAGRRTTRPTEAGALLLERAAVVIDQLQLGRRDLEALSHRSGHMVRVALHPSTGRWLLPRVIPRYKRQGSSVDLEIYETDSDAHALELLADGQVDLAFAALRQAPERYVIRQLVHDSHVILAGPDTPLARSAEVTPDALAPEPLIGFDPGCGLDALADLLEAAGLPSRFAFSSGSIDSVAAWVAAGLGVAIVTELVVPSDPRTVTVPLATPLPQRVVAMFRDGGHRPTAAASDFERAVEAAFAPEPPPGSEAA